METTSNHWTAMFDRGGRDPARGIGGIPPMPREDPRDDEGPPDLDPTEYRPWVLQRGGRPAMMLYLRRYDVRSRLWMGWQIAYPQLIAAEYTGDRMLSLDFGSRQFVIEGNGLSELARHLQHGAVSTLLEYNKQIWPEASGSQQIEAIKLLGGMTVGVP